MTRTKINTTTDIISTNNSFDDTLKLVMERMVTKNVQGSLLPPDKMVGHIIKRESI